MAAAGLHRGALITRGAGVGAAVLGMLGGTVLGPKGADIGDRVKYFFMYGVIGAFGGAVLNWTTGLLGPRTPATQEAGRLATAAKTMAAQATMSKVHDVAQFAQPLVGGQAQFQQVQPQSAVSADYYEGGAYDEDMI